MASAWMELENAFFKQLDKLQKHFDVYGKLVKPLEARGAPALAVFIIIIAVIVAALVYFLPAAAIALQPVAGMLESAAVVPLQLWVPTSFELHLQRQDGTPANGVTVNVVEGNNVIASSASSGGIAAFDSLPRKRLLFVAGGAQRFFDLSKRSVAVMAVER